MILESNLDNAIKESITDLPKTVPLKKDGKIIGQTYVGVDGVMKSTIFNKEEMLKIKGNCLFGIGGMVTSREGSLITGLNLKEVSIQFKTKWKQYYI